MSTLMRQLQLNTLQFTTDPTANDDNTKGYKIGLIWVNTSTKRAFICVDSSTGAAQWDQIEHSIDDIWERSGTDVFPASDGDDLDMLSGGYKDNNVTTAIPLGDGANTSINSSLGGNASILAGINKTTESQNEEYNTGFHIWNAGANYISTVYGAGVWTLNLLRTGSGYINGKKIPFSTVTGLTLAQNTTSYLAVNSSGVVSLADYTSYNNSFIQNNITLFGFFEYDDDTLPTRRDFQFKADYPYSLGTQSSVLQEQYNKPTLSGEIVVARVAAGTGGSTNDRKYKITTGDTLYFRGLTSTIPVQNPVGNSIQYKDGSGYWRQYRLQSEIECLYNNSGTPTTATNGKYLVYSFHVSPDGYDAPNVRYWAVMPTVQYDTLLEARNAIFNGTYTKPDGPFAAVPKSEIFFAIMLQNASGGYMYELIYARNDLSGQKIAELESKINIVNSKVTSDDLWERGTGADIEPQNTSDNLNMRAGGYKDDNVSTAITLGDASNPSIDSSLGAAGSLLKGMNHNITAQYDEGNTGWLTWSGSGSYFSFFGTSFTLSRGGTGRIDGQLITFSGSQAITVTANKTAFIGIDISGTLIKIDYDVITEADWKTHIFLFEALYTGVTNNVNICVKENHPYDYQIHSSRYEHHNAGCIIRKGFGADIYEITNGSGGAATDRQIKVIGTTVLEDHGLETTVPDSGGAAITLSLMYKSAGGDWYRHAQLSENFGYYNNAGTPTLIGQNKACVYVVYVSKDNLTVSTPTYYLVMSPTEYNDVAAAQSAIQANTIQRADNELFELEMAQLGYVIFGRSVTNHYIAETIREKSSFANATSTGGITPSSHLLLSDLNGGIANDGGHSIFALLAGRSGGQTLYGGVAASEDLTLSSTSSATKGLINFGSAAISYFDETNDHLRLTQSGETSPDGVLSIAAQTGTGSKASHALRITGARDSYAQIYATGAQNGLNINTSASAGNYYGLAIAGDGNTRFYVRDDGHVGINCNGPDKSLEVNSPTGACLRLTYNDSTGTATYYSDFSTTSAGNLTIAPSGGNIYLTGDLIPSGIFRPTGYTSITTGTYNAQSVTGIRTINADTSSGNITINGFANGQDDQEIIIFKQYSANNLIINNDNGAGTQKILTVDGNALTLTYHGAIYLRYHTVVSYWYVINY